ncbi:MAG: hypothetical protein K8S25_11895, partial [Alphaproteobacteria bacterium]|nr:hypothetical protein [Alphaproteobacteria bacterium]
MEGDLQPTEGTGAIPQAAPGASPVPEKSGRLHALGLKLRAFPVFDLRRGMASTFFCVPAKISSDGNAFGHWLLSNLSDASRAEVDIELLRAAITYATRYDEAQKVAAIGTAVSFSTLTNVSTRKAYLAGFAAARDLRAPLVVKIELIPTGTPPLRFAELVAYLKAVVSRVFVSVPDLKDPKWHLGQLGAAGIGVMVNPDDGADVVIEKA